MKFLSRFLRSRSSESSLDITRAECVKASKRSDKNFFIQQYKAVQGRDLNLRNPQLFSEKVIKRILSDKNPLYSQFSDKLACRDYIKSVLGEGFVPTMLAVVEKPEDLFALELPHHWFLKASHGSGWFRFVDDQTQPLNDEAINESRQWLAMNYYDINREWGYKTIPRKLIAEEVINGVGSKPAIEVNFFFFSGKMVLCRLFRHNQSRLVPSLRPLSDILLDNCYLDENYEYLPIAKDPARFRTDYSLVTECLDLLPSYAESASKLAGNIDFLRVDGIISVEGIKFNELTAYPGAGFGFRVPLQWDAWLGAFWRQEIYSRDSEIVVRCDAKHLGAGEGKC